MLIFEVFYSKMGNYGMRFVFYVVFIRLCINIDFTTLCSHQNNTPAVHFCFVSTAINQSIIYIDNAHSPRSQDNKCTCNITAVTLQGMLSVGWKQTFDTANISFVHQDGRVISMNKNSTIGIYITGVVYVIYQTEGSDEYIPLCLELTASNGTFSVSCGQTTRFDHTNTTDISSLISTTGTSLTVIGTTLASTISPTITNTTDTTQGISLNKEDSQNKKDSIVLLGPIIGGICAVIVISISVIVIVIVVRRRKQDLQNLSQTDEEVTTENPIYDRDDNSNHETNIQNHDANNDAVHYNTVQSSDNAYAEPNTKNEINEHDNYSKVNKTSRPCKYNTSRNTAYSQEHSDHYDRTDVKKEVQPFNEYNHLSTVHRHLNDYDRTNINMSQMNEGHDEDADTYNTTCSHKI